MTPVTEHVLPLSWEGTIVGKLVSPVSLEHAGSVVVASIELEDALWAIRLPISPGAQATLELSQPRLERVRIGAASRLVEDDSPVGATVEDLLGSGAWSVDLSGGTSFAGTLRFLPSENESRSRGFFKLDGKDGFVRLRYETRGMPNRVLRHGPSGTLHFFEYPMVMVFEGPESAAFLHLGRHRDSPTSFIDACWTIVRTPKVELPAGSWRAVHDELASLLELGGRGHVRVGLMHAPQTRWNDDIEPSHGKPRSEGRSSQRALAVGLSISALVALLFWVLG